VTAPAPAHAATPADALAPDVAELVSLSAAIAVSDLAAVARHAAAALAAGAAPAAVYEVVLQSYLFVGFPRAIEAFIAVRPLLPAAESAWPRAVEPDRWRRDGEALCGRVYGRNYERLVATMRDLSPDLAQWMILEGYGKTLSRPGLDAATREYAVLAILTVTRMWRQLRSHAIGAMNLGGTRAGVRAAIARSRPFAEAGAVEEALRVAGLAVDDAAR
jgi:4-carboxymuconolactone decarboxylase